MATFWNGDVVPDDKAAAEAVLAKLRPADHVERQPADCATIAAWAWCLHRAIDYLVTVPELDAHRIALVGHSRNGKTAILAGAFDERVALIVPSQAGCGGTAPCRVSKELSSPGADGRSIVETVQKINTSFPHWFCGNFKAFNEATERLPFDQHCLIALCAPRPVLVSCATEDRWSNPSGQFAMLRAADPAYRLTTGEGIDATEMPEEGRLLSTRLGLLHPAWQTFHDARGLEGLAGLRGQMAAVSLTRSCRRGKGRKMKAQIRELLHATPFRQFVIRLADGNEYLVEHPDFVLAATDTPQVVIEESNGRIRFLSVSHDKLTVAGIAGTECG